MKRYEIRGIYSHEKATVHETEIISTHSDRSAKLLATRRHPDIEGRWTQQTCDRTGELIPVWHKENPEESPHLLMVSRERIM